MRHEETADLPYLRKVVGASMAGTVVEWYEFFLYGTAATLVFNWDFVSFVPLIGIEIGVTSLVAGYMGAGHPEKAHRSAMSGMKMGMMYSALALVFFAGFPRLLVEVFRPLAPPEGWQPSAPNGYDRSHGR